MKRIRIKSRIAFLACIVAAFVGLNGIGSATAGQVDMHIELTVSWWTVADCDATFTTTGGLPPTTTTATGTSMTGKAGSANPCSSADLEVLSNPVFTFAGSGPYNATVNRFAIRSNPHDCDWAATNTALVSYETVLGRYNGSDSAPSTRNCQFVPPGTLSLTEVLFR